MQTITLQFSTAEISTILAALATWNESGCASIDDLIEQIATQDGRHRKLGPDQVLGLSSRIAEEASEQEAEMVGLDCAS